MRRTSRTAGSKGSEFGGVMTVFIASFAVMLAATLSIVGVRALLTAETDAKVNTFGPMTYTNTQVEEAAEMLATLENGLYLGRKGSDSSVKDSLVIPKQATVKNLEGADKKPVFIRVSLNYSIYDKDYINITALYPPESISYAVDLYDASTNPDGMWTKVGDYYYYRKIVNPGESTAPIFNTGAYSNQEITKVGDNTVTTDKTGSIELVFPKATWLDKDCEVEIDVVADTVQAVSHDRSGWTKDDYETSEISSVWKGVTATITSKPDQTVTWAPST